MTISLLCDAGGLIPRLQCRIDWSVCILYSAEREGGGEITVNASRCSETFIVVCARECISTCSTQCLNVSLRRGKSRTAKLLIFLSPVSGVVFVFCGSGVLFRSCTWRKRGDQLRNKWNKQKKKNTPTHFVLNEFAGNRYLWTNFIFSKALYHKKHLRYVS